MGAGKAFTLPYSKGRAKKKGGGTGRFCAVFPAPAARLAGGRGLLPDKGKSCFTSGANAAISGDMLTTAGITTKTDMALLKELGYEVKICNE